MKTTWLVLSVAAAALWAAPCAAQEARAAQRAAANNGSAAVSQDPLTRQILRRQLLHPNGGVETVVRLGSGQPLKLPASGEGALSGLSVDPGLRKAAQTREGAAGKGETKARPQLDQRQRDGWK